MVGEQHWHAHPQAMDSSSLPSRSLPHHRPCRNVKARRRTSGLGYIRDEHGCNTETGRRSVSHTGCIPTVVIKESPVWASPDLLGPSLELPRGWRMSGPSGTFADASPRTLQSWRYVNKINSTKDKSIPLSRLDKFEFYAPSSINTSVSSPPSSSSPMFSEPTTFTTYSHESSQRAYQATSDGLTSQPLHTPYVHSPHTATSTLSPPAYGLGVSLLPDESSSSHRRMSMDSASSQPRRAQRLMSMPAAMPSSSSRSPDHSDARSSPSHSGLDRWFPGLMYAFEPPHGSQHAPIAEIDNDSIGLDEESYVHDHAASPGELTSPPLRSLQLVSKYFGDEPDISALEDHMSDTSLLTRPRRLSAGELHGLHMVLSSDAEQMANEPVTSQVSGLRPLHLAEMHRCDAHVASRHTHSTHMVHTSVLPPDEEGHGGDESGVSSLHRSLTTRSRIPFAALHPPREKPKADPDALQLFWFGFIGMPWLWLLGGWCLNDHSALLSPWSPPSFASYRAGLHPYGPPFALSLHAKNRLLQRISPHTISPLTKDPVVFGEDHRGVQFLAQHPPDTVRLSQLQQWQHVERFVLINRIAVALSSFTFFACWTSGVWTIVSHF